MTATKTQICMPINWNAETEVCLFYAMRGHKPVGINKHFHMMCIHKKFSTSLGQTIKSSQIWEHLQAMYNLPALDDSEGLPFNNRKSDFSLPNYILNSAKPSLKLPNDKVQEITSSTLTEESVTTTPKLPKGNRKRARNIVNSNPSSPATIPVKRKR